ncbi:helix-turn-helix domain-containing protein [Patescibacteria group bacterium]|nr:helix-turn-helix domain-containing protein [Patescibacteria group bacterium]
MSDIINLELRKLGLKPKEVSVYLAALELGFSPVQKIAQSAEISRPTAYEVIRGLIKKGLMREIKKKGVIKGEKTFFTAESPDALLGLLRVQKKEIEEKEREFIRMISALQSRYYLAGQNEIRAYEGKEGLKLLLDDFSQSQTGEIFFLSGSSETLKPWREKLPEIKKRLGEIKVSEIRPKKSFRGTLIIYDKLIYLPSSEKLSALLIINKEMVELIKTLAL